MRFFSSPWPSALQNIKQHWQVTETLPHVTNAYCYLVLFREEYREPLRNRLGKIVHQSQVSSILTEHPELASLDHFKVSLTRPHGLRKDHYLAHITTSNQNDSALTWEEVLNALPYHTVLGAESEDTPRMPGTVSRLAPATFENPLVRRFLVNPANLVYATANAHNTVDWNVSTIVQWTRYFPHITIRSLKARVVPKPAAIHTVVTLRTAWTPTTVSDLTGSVAGKTYAADLPSYNVHTLGPSGAGGVPNTIEINCPFDFDISPQLKPRPTFGEPPQFYVYYSSQVIDGHSLQESVTADEATKTKGQTADALYHLFFEVVLDASPGQPVH